MTDQLMQTTKGSFTYTLRRDGSYMFTVWNNGEDYPARCKIFLADERRLAIDDLEEDGYIDRTFLGQAFNHETKQWENA